MDPPPFQIFFTLVCLLIRGLYPFFCPRFFPSPHAVDPLCFYCRQFTPLLFWKTVSISTIQQVFQPGNPAFFSAAFFFSHLIFPPFSPFPSRKYTKINIINTVNNEFLVISWLWTTFFPPLYLLPLCFSESSPFPSPAVQTK